MGTLEYVISRLWTDGQMNSRADKKFKYKRKYGQAEEWTNEQTDNIVSTIGLLEIVYLPFTNFCAYPG